MKKLTFLFLTILFSCHGLFAQDDPSLSSFALTVVDPTNIDGLSESQLSILSSKVTQIVTANGISSTNYDQSFVIYPKFQIYSVQASEGGMRKVYVADCNLSLFIKEVNTNTVFASMSKNIKGSGNSEDQAITNGITQLSSDDEQVKKFIDDGKKKIINYYVNNCSKIMEKVEADRKVKNYEAALANLLSIPQQATDCYAQTQDKVKVIFDEEQKQKCAEYVAQARAYATGNDFKDALNTIALVDPTGPCKDEAKALVTSWEPKVDDEEKKRFDFYLHLYNGQVDVAKARAQAVSSVVTSWLMSRPQNVKYETLR